MHLHISDWNSFMQSDKKVEFILLLFQNVHKYLYARFEPDRQEWENGHPGFKDLQGYHR